jgi:purine-cytosine permease-like protein
MGLGVGLAQWLLLRRDLNKTGWWPVMSAVAWPVGYMLGGILGALVGQTLNVPIIGGMVGSLLSGAIVGAITGAVLLWMLRENRALLDSMREEAEQAK